MINLDEDGLILWLAAIRNAPSGGNRNGPQSLLALYPRALYLLATNLDLLGKITGIVESYFFLDAPVLLQVGSRSRSTAGDSVLTLCERITAKISSRRLRRDSKAKP